MKTTKTVCLDVNFGINSSFLAFTLESILITTLGVATNSRPEINNLAGRENPSTGWRNLFVTNIGNFVLRTIDFLKDLAFHRGVRKRITYNGLLRPENWVKVKRFRNATVFTILHCLLSWRCNLWNVQLRFHEKDTKPQHWDVI